MTRSDHALHANNPLRFAVQALVAVVLSGGLVLPVGARDHRDHERARQAVQAGEILPLRTVLERLEREHPGQVLEVELEQDHGEWVYEVKLLQAGGQRVKLTLDARTAALLGSKTRPAHPVGRRPER